MAGLHWMAVTLALLLAAGDSLVTVTQNQLAEIVAEILNRYTPRYGKESIPPMFSLAVSIPFNSDTKMYDISKVTNDGDQVRKRILDCEVYTSERVVAATVLRWRSVLTRCPGGRVQWPDVLRKCPKTVKTWADVESQCPEAVRDGRADHAEYRTLQHFNTLVNNKDEKKKDLLLFYVRASPCDKRCTSESNRFNILTSINRILNWNEYAVVFSDVFTPRSGIPIPEDDLRGALERLGGHKGPLGSIGLENIFRCDGQQCRSCSINKEVAWYCFSDDRDNLPSTSFTQPQHGGSDSPSQSGQGDRGKQSNSIGGQGGSGPGVDSGSGGGKGKRRRNRGKKRKKNSKDAGVSSSQSGLELSKTNVDGNTGGGQGGRGGRKAKKVGGRRVVKKRRGGGNTQKKKRAQGKKKTQARKKKKTQSKGTTHWSEDVQGRMKKQSEKRRKSKQSQSGMQMQRGGEMRRINQPQKRGKKPKS